jgi:hypothetical protein
MRLKAFRYGAVAAITVGGLLAGCNWKPGPSHQLTISDTAAGISGIPARIAQGQYNITQTGTKPNIQLARLGPDYSVSQLLADAAVSFGPPSQPGYATKVSRLYSHTDFAGGLSQAGSFSTYLYPGKYVALDTDTHKMQQFTVTPAAVLASYPKSTLSISGFMTMSGGHDGFHWAVSGSPTKSGVLRFSAANGDEPHFLSVAYLHPGTTQAQCENYTGTGPAPCDQVLNTGVVSPPLGSMTIPYHFTHSGHYLITCFMPNPETGTPHAFLGMTRQLILN